MKKTLSVDAIHATCAGELADALMAIHDIGPKYQAFQAYRAGMDEDVDQDQDTRYQLIGGTALYKISGPIMSSGNEFTRWLGMADYESIRNDMIQASADPNVQDILLMIASPGGSVFGVTDAADAIKKVNAIKPVTVYSNKTVASGAYWLAVAASELIGAPESEWGSVGVIVIHASYQGQMEQDGVKVTVIKSSELKAVGGPYSDLTDKEVAHIQGQVDVFNGLFQNHVQANRPALKVSAMNGATYIGADAVKVGLADAIMTYDQVLAHIQAQRPKTTAQGGYKMTKSELRIAIDSGKTLDELGLTQVEFDAVMAEAPETKTEPAAETETPELTVSAVEFDAMKVEFETLKVALETKDAQITELTARLAVPAPELDKLKGIAAGVLASRRIALGMVNIDTTALTTMSLLAEYETTTAAYDKAFVEGGLFGLKKQTEATKLKPEPIDSTEAANLRAASTK